LLDKSRNSSSSRECRVGIRKCVGTSYKCKRTDVRPAFQLVSAFNRQFIASCLN